MESAQKSYPSLHFKHSIFHLPNHKTNFLQGTRLSSPIQQPEKEFDSDLDSIASTSSEELESLGVEAIQDYLDQIDNFSIEITSLFQSEERNQAEDEGWSSQCKPLPFEEIPKHLKSFVAERGLVLA